MILREQGFPLVCVGHSVLGEPWSEIHRLSSPDPHGAPQAKPSSSVLGCFFLQRVHAPLWESGRFDRLAKSPAGFWRNKMHPTFFELFGF